jgi:hypothetical protein
VIPCSAPLERRTRPVRPIVLGRVRKPVRNAVFPSGIRPDLLATPASRVVVYMINKTIVTSIAAATIALAAPAHADNSKAVCHPMGNGITHVQEHCLQAPLSYNGYLLPNGYGGKA